MGGSAANLTWDDVEELMRLAAFAKTDAGLDALPEHSRDVVAAFLARGGGLVPCKGRILFTLGP